MPRQELMSVAPADPEADDLADDRGEDAGRDQVPNMDAVGPGGEKPGRDQSRLGWQRNADTFESNEGCDDPDAVVRDELSHFPVSPRTIGLPADAPHLRITNVAPRRVVNTLISFYDGCEAYTRLNSP
jgi:hypothetical protein